MNQNIQGSLNKSNLNGIDFNHNQQNLFYDINFNLGMNQLPSFFMNLNTFNSKSTLDWGQNMFSMRNDFKYNSTEKTQNKSFSSGM